jgi:hypothetical protein
MNYNYYNQKTLDDGECRQLPTHQELQFVEPHGTNYDFEKDELEKTRKISKMCSELPKVKDYINNVRKDVLILLETLYDKEYIAKIYNDFMKKAKIDDPTCNLDYITLNIYDEYLNIRENINIIQSLVFFIFNFIFAYLIKIKLYDNSISECLNLKLDNPILDTIISNVKKLSGIYDDTVFKEYFKDCGDYDKKDNNLDIENKCMIYDLALFRTTITAIPNSKLSWFKQNRVSRINNKSLYKLTKDNIFPPLSKMEEEYLQNTKTCKMDQEYTNIESGALTFEPNYNSIYGKLLKRYNLYGFAGPSGSSTMLQSICYQFKSYDFELFILASIAYWCNFPHHSIFEILMMYSKEIYEKYKINIYNIDIYKFIEEIIRNKSN